MKRLSQKISANNMSSGLTPSKSLGINRSFATITSKGERFCKAKECLVESFSSAVCKSLIQTVKK